MRESPLPEKDERWLGPVAIAVLIDMGWIAQWPLSVTRGGLRAIQKGYGRDELPRTEFGEVKPRPGGAYSWEGRLP